MTIHHDKLAYGKLAPNTEELTEQQLEEMLKQLNSQSEGQEGEKEEISKNK